MIGGLGGVIGEHVVHLQYDLELAEVILLVISIFEVKLLFLALSERSEYKKIVTK